MMNVVEIKSDILPTDEDVMYVLYKTHKFDSPTCILSEVQMESLVYQILTTTKGSDLVKTVQERLECLKR